MNRREILRYVALSTGVAVSAPLLFSTIMPKTDTPSATSVGVHQMIDRMVGTVYDGDAKYRRDRNKLFELPTSSRRI